MGGGGQWEDWGHGWSQHQGQDWDQGWTGTPEGGGAAWTPTPGGGGAASSWSTPPPGGEAVADSAAIVRTTVRPSAEKKIGRGHFVDGNPTAEEWKFLDQERAKAYHNAAQCRCRLCGNQADNGHLLGKNTGV